MICLEKLFQEILEENENLESRTYKLPQYIMNELERTINKHRFDDAKPKGYNEIVHIVGMNGELGQGKLKTIKHHFDNPEPSKKDYNERTKMLGSKMRSWIENELRHIRTTDDRSKRMKSLAGANNTFKKNHTKDNNSNPTGVSIPKLHKSVNFRNMMGNNRTIYEDCERIRNLIFY